MVSSMTPRELARCPPVSATVRMIRPRSSSATRGNSSAGSALRAARGLSWSRISVMASRASVDNVAGDRPQRFGGGAQRFQGGNSQIAQFLGPAPGLAQAEQRRVSGLTARLVAPDILADLFLA